MSYHREICHCSLTFTRIFTCPDLVVSCLWGQCNEGYCGRFHADLSIKISHQILMLFTFSYFSKVFLCICGMWIVYFSIHGMHVTKLYHYSILWYRCSCKYMNMYDTYWYVYSVIHINRNHTYSYIKTQAPVF